MATNWDVSTTNWYTTDAWRAGCQPEALAEALKIGEQIIELMRQAIDLVERACADVEPIIENTTVRCQLILGQLHAQTDRLDPVLSRLRAASKAVA